MKKLFCKISHFRGNFNFAEISHFFASRQKKRMFFPAKFRIVFASFRESFLSQEILVGSDQMQIVTLSNSEEG